MGLLDMFNDPQQMGLMAAAARMMEMSGPSRTPVGLGQVIGGGLGAFQNTRQAMTQQQREEDERKQAMLLRSLQMRNLQGDVQAQEQQRKRADEVRAAMSGFNPAGIATMNGQGPTVGNAAAMPDMSDPYGTRMAMAKYLRSKGFHSEADAQELAAEKFAPEFDQTPRTGIIDGKVVQYVLNKKDGKPRIIEGMQPRDEMKLMDRGDSQEAYNPFALMPGQNFTKGLSPSDRVSIRGQNMTDRRARELNEITRQGQQTQIINDPTLGPLLVDKGTGSTRRAMMDGAPVKGEAATKKEAAARGLVPILDQAEKLLDGATGSYAGALYDEGARVFGASTGGARNIAQLKVIEGQIMMNQPRMEGPQSNLDQQLYRQMAAQIGDPTVPNQTKKAAFQTLREINSRYMGQHGASGDWEDSPIKFLGFE